MVKIMFPVVVQQLKGVRGLGFKFEGFGLRCSEFGVWGYHNMGI